MPFSSTDLIHAHPCASQQQHQHEGFVDPLGVSSVTIDWALPTTTSTADQPHQHGHSDDAAGAAETNTRRPMAKTLDTSTTSTMMSVNVSCGGLSSLGGTSVFLHNDNYNNNNDDDELCTIHSAKELLHQRQLQQQSMCSSSFSHQSLHNNTATTTTNSNDCLPQRPVAAHAVEHQQVFSVLQRLPSCIHDHHHHHHLPSSSHYSHQPQQRQEEQRTSSSRDHSVSTTAKASCTTPDPDFVRVTASHHVEGMFCQDKDEE